MGKLFFEAMSFGRPLIGADRCVIPEFVEDGYNGFVLPLNADVLADRIAAVYSDCDKYRRISHRATAAEYISENVTGEWST